MFFKTKLAILIRSSVFINLFSLLSKVSLNALNPVSCGILGYNPTTSAVTKIEPSGMLYPLNRSVGSFKCKKPGCEVCINVIETDTFTSAVRGETFKINHRFDCDEKCLVYLFACNRCGKQYTGQDGG